MKQCLGRGRKEQKQQAIQGLSVCEVGSSLQSRTTPRLFPTTLRPGSPGLFTARLFTLRNHRPTSARFPHLSNGAWSPRRTQEPGAQDYRIRRLLPGGQRRAASQVMTIREMEIQSSGVSRGLSRAAAACDWLVSGHAQWPPQGWWRSRVPTGRARSRGHVGPGRL